MKTQVSILVKNESIISRFFSLMWIINIFKKMPVDIQIDYENAEKIRLKASSEPYVFDLEPGEHAILFTDPRAGGKAAFRAATGAILGASVSGGLGGSFLAGGMIGADAAKGNTVSNGLAQFTLKEGDLLKISAKPTSKGGVKVKFIKDK